ncbi:hypothetical protein X769_09820 [Mesorhizobium sp. LSJC268A00]|nr:hypothetical protein X771_13440 [Mesorhizobium sp. LSJC277A00]ESX05045.1 hypothetical protein X768_28480 [Mesorhizobium sp. LSJC265A00]ESX07295.1 hypothetical protein X769_09820 [Mesorhizobium sp. LSJC268A00]ESX20293.1 hypothetical protein X766_06700 [Mesorhizobium sp. LSJC255A00]ESX40090.1 hypothetical protein X763_05455 [Mesorhizobium sp. LSHC432A00]ESX44985.1 hypothetical protein X764_04490 [Mesorhizobium sp. LSHC440A00]ESX49380.1 hypothetical protein X762_10660 [Mesorhizobium sp. LSHC4
MGGMAAFGKPNRADGRAVSRTTLERIAAVVR